jgi:ABC-type Co2+ transport system permease subunit
MLWAVHITDGVLAAPWWLGGYAIALALLLASAWRVREEETPRIALLTAVFFVLSLIHVRVGPTSVHLLMNGLVGIVLGPRAFLALFCGLFLQYWLVNHGGQQTIGINACVLGLPALLAWLMFRGCHRLAWLRHPWARAGLVMLSTAAWLMSLVFSVSLLWDSSWHQLDAVSFEDAWMRLLHPAVVAAILTLAALAAWAERRLESAPEFPLGLLLGGLTVLMSVGLNCAVLLMGIEGEQHWPVLPLALLVLHLPIAVFEGIVLGFTLGFLAKVKPELLGLPQCAAST